MRPKIEPLVLADLIELVPGRVRKRLDNEPTVAEGWTWSESGFTWTIAAGEETVSLMPSNGIVRSVDHVKCSCLLSPKCFHILACCNVLESVTEIREPSAALSLGGQTVEQSLPDAPLCSTNSMPIRSDSNSLEINNAMRIAAKQSQAAIAAILTVGARNAGLILQAALLRAGHQCRAVDLYALSNATLRIAEGVQRLRAHEDTADSELLLQDIFNALMNSHCVASQSSVSISIVGQARRTFESVDVRKLRGVLAEPILTLSGYAGVCVYLQAAATTIKELFTVNELRPGSSQLVTQAYQGGVELGTMTIQASQLCRSSIAVQNLTVANDGRLGKGKSTRWAVESTDDPSNWLCDGRFAKPLKDQIQLVFDATKVPSDERRGGWDLIAFDATVFGSAGSGLVVSVPETTQNWKLTIAIDDPALSYRQNLELLARCTGLAMRCLGRLKLERAGEVELLAVTAPTEIQGVHVEGDDAKPRFQLPDSWHGLCNVGIDTLQRHHIAEIKQWGDEVSLESSNAMTSWSSAVATPLKRRLVGLTLGGRSSIPSLGSRSHRRDLATLRSNLQGTGATLMDALAIAAVPSMPSRTAGARKEDPSISATLDSLFLACSIYLQHTRTSVERVGWLRGFESM